LSPISFRSLSFPSFSLAVSTLYSSRYPQCLLYNIVDALFNPPPSPLPFQSSPPCIRLDILNVFFTISSMLSNPFPPCLSAVSTFVLASISSTSS
jgi:hypothetical protein